MPQTAARGAPPLDTRNRDVAVATAAATVAPRGTEIARSSM
jgi:hypothetical protein